MKQKLLTILLAVLMSMVASVASAHDFEVDGIYYSITSSTDNTVAVSYRGYSYSSYSNEYSGDVVIPEMVTYNAKTYSVTSIGKSAFYGCTGLNSVSIPESVTEIGDYAFYGCTGLNSVSIPESVTEIGDYAFSGCTALTKAEFASIESLCGISFENYFSNPLFYANHLYINGEEVTDVVIPEGVTSIGYSAFGGCKGLQELTIPNSVTEIGDYAFYGCTGLKELTIADGEGILSLGYNSSKKNQGLFHDCPLETLYLGRPLSYDTLFSRKKTLATVVIGNSVTEIRRSAFSSCTGLTSATIGNSVTTINGFAFRNCTGLTSITIPESVTSIGSDAFEGCTGLTRTGFASMESLLGITFGNEYANPMYYAHHLNLGGRVQTKIVVPEGITAIKDYTFSGCNRITELWLSSTVEKIGRSSFSSCPLVRIYNFADYPQDCGQDAFNMVKKNCKLFVKDDLVDLYSVHQDWYEFNVLPMDGDALAVEDLTPALSQGEGEAVAYDLNGRRLTRMQKGINIIRASDGTARKVMVK